MNYQDHIESITGLNRKFRYYKSIESLFELDQWSALPSEGGMYRQQTAAFISENKNQLYLSDEAKREEEYFSSVNPDEVEDFVERSLIRSFLSRRNSAVRIPADVLKKYNMIKADCMKAWKKARDAQNYYIFMPYLEQVFELKRQIALAVEPDKPAFDTLAGMTDEGINIQEVSEQFDVLKRGIAELLLIRKNGQENRSGNECCVQIQDSDPDRMASFARRLAREAGYSPERGGFNDRVVHGFTSFMGPRDARISTYKSGNYQLIFTCLHEAGHAMYATGGNDKINEAGLWGGIEGGFHEANARFFENMIGKSREYWSYYYPQLQEEIPEFRYITENEFYKMVHKVKAETRRISADEVTYSLHAVLRFELERDYFSGKLQAADMAQAWNDKYREYLGVVPADDTEGILQDMHWAGDYIGYFQSYALGNIYDGQILQAMQKDLPQMKKLIETGGFSPIVSWMQEHIWQYGCAFTAGELLRNLTGKGLDAVPFLEYLKGNYT